MVTSLRSRQRAAIRRTTSLRWALCVCLLVTALAVLAGSRRAASETAGTEVIYVDQSDVYAVDSNPGTASRPLETISRALEVAAGYNARSAPVRVIIEPGTYRESLRLTSEGGATSAPLTLEGAGSGVVVSGSDIWTDWIGGDEGIYSHAWPFDWGLASAEEWPEHVVEYLDANPVISRREMVFVDGTPLLQVMSLDEMTTTENSFFVSEDADRLSINVPSDADLASTKVEVAVRPTLLLVGSRQNVSIRNITFQHAPNAVDEGAAVVLANSANASVVNSRFVWNNGSGLGLFEDAGISIRDSEANHNGIGGFTGFRIDDLDMVDSEASFNGWRGSRGWNRDDHEGPIDLNFIDFATGQKFFGLRHASFRNYRAVGNLAGGLWLDYDNADVRIEGAVLSRNLTHGLMVEASQGPVSVVDSQICGNETGILVNSSSDARVIRNVIAGNLLGQLVVVGGPRVVLEHDTNEQLTIQAENWVVEGNQIGADEGQLALSTYLDVDLWSAYIGTLNSGDNHYSSPTARQIFQLPGGQSVALAQWKAETGTDASSTFSLGMFDCPRSAGQPEASFLTPGLWVAAVVAGLFLLVLGLYVRRRVAG